MLVELSPSRAIETRAAKKAYVECYLCESDVCHLTGHERARLRTSLTCSGDSMKHYPIRVPSDIFSKLRARSLGTYPLNPSLMYTYGGRPFLMPSTWKALAQMLALSAVGRQSPDTCPAAGIDPRSIFAQSPDTCPADSDPRSSFVQTSRNVHPSFPGSPLNLDETAIQRSVEYYNSMIGQAKIHKPAWMSEAVNIETNQDIFYYTAERVPCFATAASTVQASDILINHSKERLKNGFDLFRVQHLDIYILVMRSERVRDTGHYAQIATFALSLIFNKDLTLSMHHNLLSGSAGLLICMGFDFDQPGLHLIRLDLLDEFLQGPSEESSKTFMQYIFVNPNPTIEPPFHGDTKSILMTTMHELMHYVDYIARMASRNPNLPPAVRRWKGDWDNLSDQVMKIVPHFPLAYTRSPAAHELETVLDQLNKDREGHIDADRDINECQMIYYLTRGRTAYAVDNVGELITTLTEALYGFNNSFTLDPKNPGMSKSVRLASSRDDIAFIQWLLLPQSEGAQIYDLAGLLFELLVNWDVSQIDSSRLDRIIRVKIPLSSEHTNVLSSCPKNQSFNRFLQLIKFNAACKVLFPVVVGTGAILLASYCMCCRKKNMPPAARIQPPLRLAQERAGGAAASSSSSEEMRVEKSPSQPTTTRKARGRAASPGVPSQPGPRSVGNSP